ncbi:MAG: branched-chain amino acid ABC transporter permease [Alphaproteobacteria bacterium]|nr:branched-chain amino acid ABC transporter permease [Alphaproteobacteria bacterium]
MEDILNAFVLLSNFVLIPALAYGSQLALGALGVTLVYGILRFSNFAHGEIMSFGAMSAILVMWGFQASGVSIAPLPTVLLALPFGILATIAMLLIVDRSVFRYYRKKRAAPVILLIASAGVMFFLNGLVRFIIGPDDQRVVDGERFIIRVREFKQMTGLDQGLALKTSQGISVLAAIVCVGLLFWFLNHTRSGKSMRAYSDNEDLALLSGVNPDRVVLYAWILAGSLAAIAGTLYGLDKSYKPFTFLQLLLPIFAAAIVGGIGSPIGATVGGFVIAFSEVTVTYAYKRFLAYMVPDSWAPEGLAQLLSTDYKFAVSFMILVIVLIVRPTGIFSGKTL